MPRRTTCPPLCGYAGCWLEVHSTTKLAQASTVAPHECPTPVLLLNINMWTCRITHEKYIGLRVFSLITYGACTVRFWPSGFLDQLQAWVHIECSNSSNSGVKEFSTSFVSTRNTYAALLLTPHPLSRGSPQPYSHLHPDTATNVGYINSQRDISGLGTYFNLDYIIGVRTLLAFKTK